MQLRQVCGYRCPPREPPNKFILPLESTRIVIYQCFFNHNFTAHLSASRDGTLFRCGEFNGRPAVAPHWSVVSFYGWWDVRFVVLPVAQIAATLLLALVHERTHNRAPLIIGVALNLFSLATFKYLNFLLASIDAATGIALPRAHIILPIGIRFFSFQLISYLVDRMRGQATPAVFHRIAGKRGPQCRLNHAVQRGITRDHDPALTGGISRFRGGRSNYAKSKKFHGRSTLQGAHSAPN
jgi:hypothetical protein